MDYNQRYKNTKKRYTGLKSRSNTYAPIFGISGISGAGKSTVAKKLAERHGGIYVDQDWFYREKKPIIVLSNGIRKYNWDHIDALDIERMNSYLRNKLKLNKPIFLAGFALRNSFFDDDTKLTYHVHLVIPKEVSLKTRLKVKNFKDRELETQRLMFEEAVYPFYEETLKDSTIDETVAVMDPESNYEERRDLEDEIEEINELIIPYL